VDISGEQEALLRRSRDGVLVTVGPGGSPHAGPVWYLWDGAEIRISTPRTTQKVRDIGLDPRVAFCVDDQVAGEYLTLYGRASIVADERVTELTRPLLLKYLQADEATARWSRINADGSRVVILLRPARLAGREQVRLAPGSLPDRSSPVRPEQVQRADDLAAQPHRQRLHGPEPRLRGGVREPGPALVRAGQVGGGDGLAGAEAFQAGPLVVLQLEQLQQPGKSGWRGRICHGPPP
jgi:PPOX class probable F420-dependent enzyme